MSPTPADPAADAQDRALRRDEVREVRDRITPHAFGVDPELVGLPLAGHARRVGAILVDLFLVALLSNAGGVLLGLVAGVLLLRVALRTRPDQTPSLFRTAFQGSMGCMGALILFVLIVSLWGTGQRLLGPSPPEVAQPTALRDAPELATFVGALQEGVALRGVESPEELEERALVLAERLQEMGLTREEAGEVAAEMAGSLARPSALGGASEWVPPEDWWREWEAASAEVGVPPPPPAPPSDTLALDTVAADTLASDVEAPGEELPAPDTQLPVPDTLLPTLDSATVARLEALSDSMLALQGELERERGNRVRAEEALVAAELRAEGGRIRRWLSRIADDLGLGLGWGALYFTVTLTWWQGRTPGKRLFGLRVVQLNGRPITWWCAFERYGGYAAGFATGLLGFAQVYWDANRQATHDKISATVVIRDGAEKLPLPRTFEPAPPSSPPPSPTPPGDA